MKTWTVTLWALAMIALAMVLLLSEAKAQLIPPGSACRALADVLERLREHYSEYVVMTGAMSDGQIFVTSNDEGRFTIIHARDGVGCIIAVGQNAAFDRGV